MKKLLTAIILAGLICLIALPAWAKIYQVDPVHSGVYFKIEHIVGTVVGHFDQFKGTLDWDSKQETLNKLEFTIKTASINTNIDKRDEHLKTADFFEVEKYPQISFVSTEIQRNPDDPDEILMSGRLTIKDVTQDVVFNLYYLGEEPHPVDTDKTVAGFNGFLTINRLDFHVGTGKFVQMGMVGSDVDIEVFVEALADK